MGKKKSHKLRNWILVLLMLAAVAGVAVFLIKQAAPKPIHVQTEKVARRNLTELVIANGRIQPVLFVKISPEVSGEIIELPVKEGQSVKKGDVLLRIKPDFYKAIRNSADASLKSSLSGKDVASANLERAETEFKRAEALFKEKLLSASQFQDAKSTYDSSKAQIQSASHQVDVARASLARAEEDLSKTTIYSPLSGTISKLNSQLGERVVGTATYQGTEVMTIADLDNMEARVDIGEIDVVLIGVGQKARLEVDAFRDRKFTGTVSEIANTAKTAGTGSQNEATKFEVKIRIQEKASFRPGMSCTAEVETRYRTNVLAVPIQSVTTRLPKGDTNKTSNAVASVTNVPLPSNVVSSVSKTNQESKQVEVVFVVEDGVAKSHMVKRGISDDVYVEILSGIKEGEDVVSGGYKAITRELEEGKKVIVGTVLPDKEENK